MREIIFRGRRLDNGEWTFGTPFFGGDSCKMIFAVALHPDFVDEGNVYYSEGHSVDPATVGQFTGLIDKNGKKIFEGDVVLEKHTGYKAVVEWQSDTCRFLAIIANRRSERSPHFFYVDKGSDRGSQMSSNEIIGNIHDNQLGGAE